MGEEGEVDFQAQQEALEAEATDQSLDWAQEYEQEGEDGEEGEEENGWDFDSEVADLEEELDEDSNNHWPAKSESEIESNAAPNGSTNTQEETKVVEEEEDFGGGDVPIFPGKRGASPVTEGEEEALALVQGEEEIRDAGYGFALEQEKEEVSRQEEEHRNEIDDQAQLAVSSSVSEATPFPQKTEEETDRDREREQEQEQEEVQELTYSLASSNPFGNAEDGEEDDFFGAAPQQYSQPQAPSAVVPAVPAAAPVVSVAPVASNSGGPFGVTEQLSHSTANLNLDSSESFFDNYGAVAHPQAQQPITSSVGAAQETTGGGLLHQEGEVGIYNPQVEQTYTQVEQPTYAESMPETSSHHFPVANASSSLNEKVNFNGAANGNGSDFFDNYDTPGASQFQQQQPSVYQSQQETNSYQMQQEPNPYQYQSQEQQQAPEVYQPNMYQPDMYQHQQPTEIYQPPSSHQQDTNTNPYQIQQPEMYQSQQNDYYYSNNNAASYSSAPGANEYSGGAYGYSNTAEPQPMQATPPAIQAPTLMVPTAAEVPLASAEVSGPSTTSTFTPTLMTPQFDPNAHQTPQEISGSGVGWDSFSGQSQSAGGQSTALHGTTPPPPPAMMVASEVQPQPNAHEQQNYQAVGPNGMYNSNNYQQQNTGNSGQSYGRPPCSMMSFGFGGRVCYYSQQLQQLKVTTAKEFIQEESNAPGLSGLSASDASSYSNSLSKHFSQEKLLMESFPGPLAGIKQGQVKSELQKFFSGSCDNNGAATASERMCTRVLNILVQQCEKLSKLPNSDLSQQLASVLLPASTAGETGVFSNSMGNTDHYNDCPLQTAFQQMDPNEAASQMQNLLCQGKGDEALKVALQGQLWGPALALGHYMGQEKLGDTISAMASSCLVKGSPLERLMLSIADSQGPNRNNSSSSLNSFGESGQQKKSSINGEQLLGQGFGFLNSAGKNNAQPLDAGMTSPYSAYSEQGPTLHAWEKSLCILANNRKEWKNVAIKQLGDDLLDKNRDTFGAHLCYVIATFPFEPFTEASRLCLVGWNHLNPVPIVDTKCIQLSEVYEWLMTQINSQHVSFAFQPYKLLYAFKLLDMGHILDATKYCQCVLKSFEGKNRLTPELTLCKFKAETLMQRLHVYMKVQNIDLPSSNNKVTKMFTSIGGWMDKGIHYIMGEDGSESPHMNMTAGPEANMQQQAPFMQPGNPMDQQQQQQQPGFHQPAIPSMPSAPASASAPASDQSGQNAAQKAPAAAQKKTEKDAAKKDSHKRTNSGGGSNLFRSFSRNLGIGSIGRALRSSVNDPSYKEAKLGKEENTFFFDKELGIWREKGKDPPKAGGALPPPPTEFGHASNDKAAPAEASASASDAPPGATPPILSAGGDQTSDGSSHVTPVGGPPPLRKVTPGSSRGSVRSRYVDTFNHSSTTASTGTGKQATASSSLKSLVPNGNRMGGSGGPAMFVPPSMNVSGSNEKDDGAGNSVGQDGSLGGEGEEKKESSTPSPSPAMFMPTPVVQTDDSNTGTSNFGAEAVDALAPKPMAPMMPTQGENNTNTNTNGNGNNMQSNDKLDEDSGQASAWVSYQADAYAPMPMAYSSFTAEDQSAPPLQPPSEVSAEATSQEIGGVGEKEEDRPWALSAGTNDDYQDVDF